MRQTLVYLFILILLIYTVEWYYTKQRQLSNNNMSIVIMTLFPALLD